MANFVLCLDSVTSLSEGANLEVTEDDKFSPVEYMKIVGVEHGVHYYEDGHFFMEVPGLPPEEEDDELEYPAYIKKSTKVCFSSGPITVFSTYSMNDYDRRC